jgi:hypothetical protein
MNPKTKTKRWTKIQNLRINITHINEINNSMEIKIIIIKINSYTFQNLNNPNKVLI